MHPRIPDPETVRVARELPWGYRTVHGLLGLFAVEGVGPDEALHLLMDLAPALADRDPYPVIRDLLRHLATQPMERPWNG